MTSVTAGYDGDNPHDEELPDPETLKWRVPLINTGSDGVIYARLQAGTETLGLLRVPNAAYLRFIRKWMTHDPS